VSNEFKTRLYNFEVAPPLAVWDKITYALDDIALTEGLSSKLYQLELVPPVSVWQKISSVLQRENRKVPVPFLQRARPYYRYAAAAVIIGLITFAISLLTSKKNIANVAKEAVLPSSRKVPAVVQKDNQNTNAENQNITASLTAPNKKRMIAESFFPAGKPVEEILRQKLMNSPNHYSAPAVLETNFSIDGFENNSGQLNYATRSFSDFPKITQVNRYMMLLRPDGYIFRMSKKLSNMVNCMYSVSAIEEDANCKDQLKQWREKIAKSTITPSPDNFMDILTLIKSLDEN
jgi:hypothetical protein